ncbi:hypothetical protein [Nocardioides sp. zg-DK7169]|uniref:hypothetical protein n=1 Tax=Nocardioides sp. zg-DK7169 TaxID=2736600 RepID=UPI001552A312|nr:hypothetical protein [Nocardioides sp. zg-DK7169]NPC98439.1 hypothetical protein [Nocardioides sp. zg-DK7169]
MTPERFWELIGSLGGVADDASCERLDLVLQRSGEGDAFADQVEVHVADLLRHCGVPADLPEDTDEWVAAAVVAAGREAYETTIAAGEELDPTRWRWQDAEALLVTGWSSHAAAVDPTPREHDPGFPVTLQWKVASPPPGVVTSYGTDDLGDDPETGVVATSDPAWDRARRDLGADPALVEELAGLDWLDLHLVVRDGDDVTEPVLHPYPSPTSVRSVVLVVPQSLFADPATRADAYVEAVQALVAALAGRIHR